MCAKYNHLCMMILFCFNKYDMILMNGMASACTIQLIPEEHWFRDILPLRAYCTDTILKWGGIESHKKTIMRVIRLFNNAYGEQIGEQIGGEQTTSFESCEFAISRVTYFQHYKLRRLIIYLYII